MRAKITTPSKAKHEEKFKSLFREYFSSLCIFAYRYLSDTELSKDVVHDVFAGLWESPERLEQLLNEKSYLYTLVRNHCLDVLRKQSVRKKFSATVEFAPKTSEEYPDLEALREETYRQLDFAINQLPKRSREILRLKMSGLKNEEIARQLNLSVNTVNTLKTNAYKFLRAFLKGKSLIYFLLLFSEKEK